MKVLILTLMGIGGGLAAIANSSIPYGLKNAVRSSDSASRTCH